MNVIPFEYQGQAVRFSVDGWINATDIARRFGKRPAEWLRLPDTIEYMQALSEVVGESKVGKSHFGLVATNRGGRTPGTWLHPKLAVSFARWLDARFAVWCDMQVDALLHGDQSLLHQLGTARRQLSAQEEKGSKAGRELADHRWRKPPLLARVHRLEESLQMKLELAR